MHRLHNLLVERGFVRIYDGCYLHKDDYEEDVVARALKAV
jgi:hypothetical protein